MSEEPLPETIPGLLAWRARERPGAPWLLHGGAVWTFAEAAAAVDRRAVGLAERGVRHGDRVVIALGNHPEAILCWFAANRVGAVAVLINPALTAPELGALFAVVRPRLAVAVEHAPLVGAALGHAGLPAVELAPPEALAAHGSGAPTVTVTPDDTAVLIPTSGTTGSPKAVMQSHRTYTLTAEAFPWWLGLGTADCLGVALPLFHINAQAYSTLGSLGAGASLALLPRFSASRFWRDLAAATATGADGGGRAPSAAPSAGVTSVNLVGAMLHLLLQRPPDPADRAHAVRVVYAALALPEAQHRAFEERFGVELLVGYGMSETTFGTVWPRGGPPRHGSMGRLRQHPRLGAINHARLVHEGRDVDGAGEGELWLRNPGTMSGYFGAEAATREALVPAAEGGAPWLRTGDVVRRDAEGWYTFVARRRDVLRRRGENVSATEIELVLLEHPAVAEAAVVGVPSPLGEDDLEAWVAPRAGADLDVAALRAFAAERLAAYKVPGVFHVRAALPRTPTERVAKHLLK